MKIICVGDAYITCEMMKGGIESYLTNQDVAEYYFFGEQDRIDMRETVKAIEAMRRDSIEIPDQLYTSIADCDLLIVHLCPVTRKLLANANKLKAILLCRGGTENVDLQAATEKGIIVSNNPAHNASAVAEYTIGVILCETRNIARADAALKNGIWREKFPNTETTIRELKDMTVGIMGFGAVGRLVAEKLSVFGCNIFIYDPYISESAYDFINFTFVDKKTLLNKSDIITIHARSDKAIITEAEFSEMKRHPYLVNTSRSVLVDSNALKDALENNVLLGAAIDVFETEPQIPDFYRHYDNLTITNHRGGDTINSYKDAPVFAIENYRRFLDGGRLRFWVNKESLQLKE